MTGTVDLSRRNGIRRIPSLYSAVPAIVSNTIKHALPKPKKTKPRTVVRNAKTNKKRTVTPTNSKSKTHRTSSVSLTTKRRARGSRN